MNDYGIFKLNIEKGLFEYLNSSILLHSLEEDTTTVEI